MVGWWWGNFSPAAWAVQHSTQTFSRETVFQNTSVFISEYACISYSFALLGTYKTAHNYWRWRWLKRTSSQRCRRGHRAAGRRGEGEKLTQKQKHTLKLLFTNVCWKKRLLAQASRKRVIRIITKNDRQFTISTNIKGPVRLVPSTGSCTSCPGTGGDSRLTEPGCSRQVCWIMFYHFQRIFTLWVWAFCNPIFVIVFAMHFNIVQVPGSTVVLHQVVTSLISGNCSHPLA